MGSPRRLRKKVVGPRHPFSAERIESEMKLAGQYGLRNKKEIWKVQTKLRRYRQRARKLLALSEELKEKEERVLLDKLIKLAIIPEGSTLDNVLDLQVNSFLDRRLQSIVHKLGMASTLHQARQFIVHGHVSINGRKVKSPSYHVKLGMEGKITYSQTSPVYNQNHPIRRAIMENEPVRVEETAKDGGVENVDLGEFKE
ncbi:MAG: 30S ribosomal protein S4 [Candidatus Hodarchaeales archaeon]